MQLIRTRKMRYGSNIFSCQSSDYFKIGICSNTLSYKQITEYKYSQEMLNEKVELPNHKKVKKEIVDGKAKIT